MRFGWPSRSSSSLAARDQRSVPRQKLPWLGIKLLRTLDGLSKPLHRAIYPPAKLAVGRLGTEVGALRGLV